MNTVNKIIEDFNQYYASNELDKAIKLIEENKYKFDAANYHFYLGAALAKKGDLPIARFSLEKSMKLGNIDPKLSNNLDYVVEKLELTKLEESEGLKDFTLITTSHLSSQFFLTIALLIMLLSSVFYKKLNSILKIVILLSLAGLASLKFFFVDKMSFCITFDEVSVFEGPSAIFTEVTKLPAGIKYLKGEVSGEYVFINYPARFNGWVQNSEKGCLNSHE